MNFYDELVYIGVLAVGLVLFIREVLWVLSVL